MKLFVSTTSPFVRKVLISAAELGVESRIERLSCAVHVIRRDANVVAQNPLGQIPTLITDDGQALYDSRVICEYLHELVPGPGLFPADRKLRFQALLQQALADGLLNAALLGRQEVTVRPAEKSWDQWGNAQMEKIVSALDRFEQFSATYGGRVDIGTISTGCAVSYLDFRYPDFNWRKGRPTLTAWYARMSERPSFTATRLHMPSAT